MDLGTKVVNLIGEGVLTQGEVAVLLPSLEHLENYVDEYDEIFGGYSDLEISDLPVNPKEARGHLSSLVKKGFLKVNTMDVNGTNHQFIYLGQKGYDLLTDLSN